VAQIAAQHLTDFCGFALSQIDSAQIERWKAARMMAVSSETVAKELRTLKAILNKAVEWGEIEKSPAQYVESPKNLQSEPMTWYTKAQLAKLYKTNRGAEWRLMANTGLRRTEARQLKWAQVDLKRRTLDVISSAQSRTKSGRWRQVPLSDGALAALKTLRRRAGTSDYVIPRIMARSLSRAFTKATERLGLPGSLHSLRHSYGAHLVMAGVPLRTLQVLMGHASMKTTERYAHLGRDHLRDRARRISL